jgi:hypothetical protein
MKKTLQLTAVIDEKAMDSGNLQELMLSAREDIEEARYFVDAGRRFFRVALPQR